MNVENDNLEPETDLGLRLGNSNQRRQKILNNDSGAGANAGSEIDMTFVANDPLTELVWSPHKGVNLKYQHSSFSNIKFTSMGAGPSNVVLTLPQSIMSMKSTVGRPIDDENFLTRGTSFQVNTEVDAKDISKGSSLSDAARIDVYGPSHEPQTGSGGEFEEVNKAVAVSPIDINPKEDLIQSEQDDFSAPAKFETDEKTENEFSSFQDQVKGKEVGILSIKSHQPQFDGAHGEPSLGNSLAGNRTVDSSNWEVRTNVVLASEINPVRGSEDEISQDRKLLEKVESTSENDIQNIRNDYVHGAASTILPSEFVPEVINSYQENKIILPPNNTDLGQHSLTSSSIHVYQSQGREKALSVLNMKERMPKDEEDSDESVESCNSAGLFSAGKKRCRFEEKKNAVRKRFKRSIQGTGSSTPFTGQNSSFMNWISNMTKGFSKSIHDEGSLALSLRDHDHVHHNIDRKLVSCNQKRESEFNSFGFQSIFESIHLPKAEGQEIRTFNDCHQIEEQSKDPQPGHTICDINATPIACHRENSDLGRQGVPLIENFSKSPSGYETNLATQPNFIPEKNYSCEEKSINYSAENKNTYNLEITNDKERTSSSSSVGKKKRKSVDNVDSESPLKSLWIARFAPKISSSSTTVVHQNQIVGGVPECSTGYTKEILSPQYDFSYKLADSREHSTEDQSVLIGKKIRNHCATGEGPIISISDKRKYDSNSTYNLNPNFAFPKLKDKETVNSIFARRLDKLKHGNKSLVKSDAATASLTCLFCGMKGHNLRGCPEVVISELQEIQRKISTLNGASTSLNDHCSPSKMLFRGENEENTKLQAVKETEALETSSSNTHVFHHEDELKLKRFFSLKMNEMEACKEKIYCTSSVKKNIASCSGGIKLKNQGTPCSHFVNTRSLDVPQELLDAVKKLRLSRTDIFKWKSSNMPFSHLNGFYLRLRLGKWEEGLGGTGYQVACITGTHRDIMSQDAKNSVFVSVGGIRCLVECHYISNHDFLEDELMAWWSATSKSGGNIPSEEDLEIKLKKKRMLGF